MSARIASGATDRVPGVAPWARVSAVVAPVAMIGGWLLAESLQPSFDPVTETISALAVATRTTPWVLGVALVTTGAAHVVTALGTRRLRPAARAVLALGGVATAAVGLLPVDAHPQAHGVAAGVGFGALALWPALTARRARSGGTGVERPLPALGGTALLTALVVVFVVTLASGSGPIGLTERLAAGAQSLWPLLVVLALRRRDRRG
ncbi:DUF998 domain-containing protein [Litorihabitans aurantiacus]|uniref:DUF998 domain-containing protein n=1 Tax=Litorihabitans aurantiacus TaxID=1930061 RepID=A0AA37XEW7_9MICO|nr:DUF998 domain-containing protein [Litorihabitans aurantiacus]GMA31952.1 hypothetical protein GCM10025875_19440 [Litorihabitans aurantiacus]